MSPTGRTPRSPVIISYRPLRTPEARELAEAFRKKDAELLASLNIDYQTLELRVLANTMMEKKHGEG